MNFISYCRRISFFLIAAVVAAVAVVVFVCSASDPCQNPSNIPLPTPTHSHPHLPTTLEY